MENNGPPLGLWLCSASPSEELKLGLGRSPLASAMHIIHDCTCSYHVYIQYMYNISICKYIDVHTCMYMYRYMYTCIYTQGDDIHVHVHIHAYCSNYTVNVHSFAIV